MKTKSPRVAQKRLQVRKEILAAAQTVLSEEGADALSLAAVARRLGITKQAIYHYFPCKEALDRALVTSLLDEEIDVLVTAVDKAPNREQVLGEMIRAFYAHYISRLDAFRAVYLHLQLQSSGNSVIDEATLREEIHPRTRRLFDLLEDIIVERPATKARRKKARLLAFTAWTSALGLMTMIGVAERTKDPLVHAHDDLLQALAAAFTMPEH